MKSLSLILLALLLAGCGTPGTPPPPLVLGLKQSDAVYRIAQGGLIEIRLPSNPSSGYRWDIDQLDPVRFTVVGPRVFEPADPAQPAGAGTEIFRLRAAHLGLGMVRLAHRQPWEQANKGETFTAMIHVE